jgi:hypothetical protein
VKLGAKLRFFKGVPELFEELNSHPQRPASFCSA